MCAVVKNGFSFSVHLLPDKSASLNLNDTLNVVNDAPSLLFISLGILKMSVFLLSLSQ